MKTKKRNSYEYTSPYKQAGVERKSLFSTKKIRKCKDSLAGVGKYYNSSQKKNKKSEPLTYRNFSCGRTEF